MPKSDYTAFSALDPFFAVVMEGLSKFVDGEHYFDTLADDVLFEFRYDFPGYLTGNTRPQQPHIALFRVREEHPARPRRFAGRASFPRTVVS